MERDKMQFKEAMNKDNGCSRWQECKKGFLRCCIRCEESCKKCTPSLIFHRQTNTWKCKNCSNLKDYSELAWDSIFKVSA